MSVNNSQNTILLPLGVVQSDGSGNLSSSAGTNGQLLIGSTAGQPAWNSVTSTGATVIITPGAGTLNLETSGGAVGLTTFTAIQPSNQSLAAATTYSLGSSSILTEIFDSGGNFFPGNGVGSPAVFTAPATGKYDFSFQANISNQLVTAPPRTQFTLVIVTSNRSYTFTNRFFTQTSVQLYCMDITALADMDSGDTATFTITIDLSTSGALVGSSTPKTWVSGKRIT